jgi:ribosomal protein L11 methyltransferase
MMVAPPWDLPAPGRSNRTLIQILPAMAFGTGTHPTTRNALLFLEACILTEGRRSVLDVGTGSGILAIAAAKLGADRVTAVENDPVALAAAEENAKLNGVASKIVFRKTIPRAPRYSCLVANITAPTLISLSSSLTRPVSKGGKIILSGILTGEREAVLNHYKGSSSLLKSKRGGEWVTLLLARR